MKTSRHRDGGPLMSGPNVIAGVLCQRHGWRKLMPRPFHPRQDIAAQNAFKKAAFLVL
jgi:hypothetical protein